MLNLPSGGVGTGRVCYHTFGLLSPGDITAFIEFLMNNLILILKICNVCKYCPTKNNIDLPILKIKDLKFLPPILGGKGIKINIKKKIYILL